MRRSVLAVATAFAALACGEAPTSSTTEAVQSQPGAVRYETSFRMSRIACNGERVTLVGMTDVTWNQQYGVTTVTLKSVGQGAGQFTAYKLSWLRSFQLVQGQATHEGSSEILRLVGTANTPDTFIRGITTATLNPDGTVVADVDFSDEACLGG